MMYKTFDDAIIGELKEAGWPDEKIETDILIHGKPKISRSVLVVPGIFLHVIKPRWFSFSKEHVNMNQPVFLEVRAISGFKAWFRNWWPKLYSSLSETYIVLWSSIPMSNLQTIPEIEARYTKDGHIMSDAFIRDELRGIQRLLLEDIAGTYSDPNKVLKQIAPDWYLKEMEN